MSDTAPRIRYTVGLQEAVVDLLLRQRTVSAGAQIYGEYRRRADRIYVLHAQPEDRVQAFRLLYARLFETLACGEPMSDAVGELSGLVDEVIVSRAWSQGEEGAELSRDHRTVGVRLRPARFAEPADLRRFLRHEFGRIGDILDETFGYGDGVPEAAGAFRTVGEHFGFLWGCSVDGRTARAGRESWRTRAEYEEACALVFSGISADAARTVVVRLWEGERPTYRTLLQLAADRAAFAAFAGMGARSEPGNPVPLRGGRCPLCGFPTHEWAPAIDEPVAERITADFPHWERGHGACARCIEGYTVRVQPVRL